jgi:hypothetical protein
LPLAVHLVTVRVLICLWSVLGFRVPRAGKKFGWLRCSNAS